MTSLTLPTGRVIPLDYLTFDPAGQRAYYGNLDVTPYLTRAQLQTVGGADFDVERANREASDAARLARGQAPYADGTTTPLADTLRGTLGGIGDDLATAAQGVRDFVGIGPEHAGKRSPLFWFAVVAGLAYLAHQIGLFVWIRKKLSV